MYVVPYALYWRRQVRSTYLTQAAAKGVIQGGPPGCTLCFPAVEW